ncbi:MAG: hypothetical protein ACI3ZX_04180 [Candidatus Aphodosoma sp.]
MKIVDVIEQGSALSLEQLENVRGGACSKTEKWFSCTEYSSQPCNMGHINYIVCGKYVMCCTEIGGKTSN